MGQEAVLGVCLNKGLQKTHWLDFVSCILTGPLIHTQTIVALKLV